MGTLADSEHVTYLRFWGSIWPKHHVSGPDLIRLDSPWLLIQENSSLTLSASLTKTIISVSLGGRLPPVSHLPAPASHLLVGENLLSSWRGHSSCFQLSGELWAELEAVCCWSRLWVSSSSCLLVFITVNSSASIGNCPLSHPFGWWMELGPVFCQQLSTDQTVAFLYIPVTWLFCSLFSDFFWELADRKSVV